MKYLVLLLVPFAYFSCSKEAELQSKTYENEIDPFVEAMMDSFDIKGSIAIGIVRHNETLFERAYGYADAERKLRATSTTPYYIASITKSFMGTLCAILEEQALIDLEEPLETAIPFEISKEVNLDDVLFIDLLTHTSGIQNPSVPFKTAYSSGFTKEEILRDFKELSYQTTQGYEYTNLGYIIAGMILEDKLGKNWKDLLKEHVLDTIGMKNTSAYVSDYHPDSLAKPYSFDMSENREGRFSVHSVKSHPFPKSDDIMHAAGGLLTTIEDMNKWMKFHLTGTPTILNKENMDYVHTDLVGFYENHGPLNSFGYGMGWLQSDWGEFTISSHSGGYSGYVSITALHRESGLGVTILSNQLNPAVFPLLSFLLGQFLDRSDLSSHLENEISSRLNSWKRYKHQLDSVGAISEKNILERRNLSSYTGQYQDDSYGIAHVRDMQGQLHIDMGNIQFSTKYLGDDTFLIVSDAHFFSSRAIFDFSNDDEKAYQMTIVGSKFQRLTNNSK